MSSNVLAKGEISDRNDTRISAMLDAIDQQNFEKAGITAIQAKTYIMHFLYDSKFAAIGGGNFNYPNKSGPVFGNITDGTYTKTLSEKSAGCKAYALFVSDVVYGNEGQHDIRELSNEQKTDPAALKAFLKENAQAGEQIRTYYTARNPKDDKAHSMAFISCNDDGLYVLGYSGNLNDPGGAPILLKYFTYADFISAYGNRQIWLRNANQSLNSAVPQCVHNYNSLGVCDKCGKSYPYTVSKSIFNVTLAAKANAQSKPYGHSAYYKSTLPAGTTVAVAATTKNHYGNTWYQMTDGNWICSDRCKSFSQKVDDKKPAVTISGEVSPSGTLKQGSNFGLRGAITTDCGKITSVTGSILDSSGNTVSGQSKTYMPNAASFDIRTTLNNDLIFNKLPAGSYTYYVKAVAENGTQSAQWTLSRKFTIGAAEQCVHSYNSLGVCDKCGQAYAYTVTKANFSVTIVDKAYVQSKPYGNSAYYKSTLSNGTTVSVTGTAKNHYGNVWYQMADGNWISSDRCKTVTQETFDQKPTITISGEVSPSGTLKQGSNFGLRGVISTDCGKLTSVTGYIMDGSGNKVSGQIGSYTPNTTSFDIRTTINNDLIFNYLAEGTYTYVVYATAQNGAQSTNFSFYRAFIIAGVKKTTAVPTITLSDATLPSTLAVGSNFGIRGIVQTDIGQITKVYGAIVDSSGATVQDAVYYPNTAEHNLRYSINNDLIFNDLPAGSYMYIVQAWAENDGAESSKQVISQPFAVKDIQIKAGPTVKGIFSFVG